ncbi:MAG: hypothetical protein JW763_01625 [candidate division Zixibacteria bacterium]|nr:hypothetical protein [candidate division Zixibacteria bacterium]
MTCIRRIVIFLIAAAIMLPTIATASYPENFTDIIDTVKAKACFELAQSASERDGGKLWGEKLYGPMLFVDPQSRIVVANQPDREDKLERAGGLYVGDLDESVNMANTAVSWAGVTWAMILWPKLQVSEYDQTALMMHESWHRIQDQLGFPAVSSQCDHLDQLDGRFLLKMEWRALAVALMSQKAKREKALKDVLLFRWLRRQKFDNAARYENEYEMHEGLAEYTGLKLSGLTDNQLRQIMAKRLKAAEDNESFIMSFAYQSGPAYGILFDNLKIDWREQLPDINDFGDFLGEYLSFVSPDNVTEAACKRYDAYDGNTLYAIEQAREELKTKLHDTYIAMFIDGPVLVLPNANMNIAYNSEEHLFPLDDYGLVYPTLTISADWGKLTVTDGVLRDKNWMFVKVTAPEDTTGNPVAGDGWSLEINDGWKIIPAGETGNYIITKK